MYTTKFGSILMVLGGFLALYQPSLADHVSLENPVRPADQDQIVQLPDYRNTTFKQYSGYLAAKEDGKPDEKRFLHYWLVESEQESNGFYLWLNGGPGCSSMSNLLRSIGPVIIDQDGQVLENPNSWNKKTNILFIDGPVGTGYSYSLKGHVDSDDYSSLEDNFKALMSFYRKFPQYKRKELYLFGESYAAVYLTLLAERIIEREPSIPLVHITIGNGYTDAKRLGESLVFYSYYHGLYDTATWREISTYCCDGNTPDHKKCHFSATSVNCLRYLNLLSSYILNPKPGLNPQNIYDSDYEPPASTETRNVGRDRRSSDRRLLTLGFQGSQCERKETNEQLITKNLLVGSLKALTSNISSFEAKFEENATSGPSALPFCADTSMYHENYMNREDVKVSLHIPERLQRSYKQCSRQVFTTYKQILPYQKGGIAPVMKKVLDSNNTSLFMYNGDIDLVANFIGNDWFTEEIEQDRGIRFAGMAHKPFEFQDKVVGFVKSYDKVSYMTIKGAGHSPITERTALLSDMFARR